MAMASSFAAIYKNYPQPKAPRILCRKKERDRGQIHPYKVIEITPPPKSLGVRCFAPICSITSWSHALQWKAKLLELTMLGAMKL
ncbi:hypothetical protein RHGRI_022796 [Rhododendron griersonianum]|uniref:Uncharacterized protein n=1 Tax=Rhododendron griersonianum TaxID=479676 RepID=A0AAV6J0T5_9ERIC|nr:hypothetical protein RHGRI_022796 [Rhododendron griersonianum]